jgi:uncharacterized membrane protein YciS (DUF1049 family)
LLISKKLLSLIYQNLKNISQVITRTKVFRAENKTPKLANQFKNLYRPRSLPKTKLNLLFSPNQVSTQPTEIVVLADKPKLLTLFTTHFKLNSATYVGNHNTHSSWESLYLGHRSAGCATLSIHKFFTFWVKFYNLLLSLFYYKINLISFGTVFFREEILALNSRLLTKKYPYKYRYNYTFICFIKNKIATKNLLIFKRLARNHKIALVLDTNYHKQTLNYLHMNSTYTIAPTGLTSSAYSACFTVPVALNSVLSQLFFLRIVFFLKKQSQKIKYQNSLNIWKNTH